MDLADALLDPWRSGIGRRAVAEVVLLASLCGGLGFWVIRYGLVYGAESLAHGLLPGLVIAGLAGAPLVLGAAGGALAAALLLAAAARDERIGTDAATAVVVTGLLGLGGLLALAPDAPARLSELLFGDPLAASRGDVGLAAALALTGAVALAALHRPLAAVAFDGGGAAALGVKVAAVRVALLVLLAVAVAVGARGLGNLLVLAAIVAPPLAVARHVRGPGSAVLAGAAVGALAGVAGLYASHHLEVAAGGAIALALCAAAGLGAMRAPRGVAGAGAAGRPAPSSPR